MAEDEHLPIKVDSFNINRLSLESIESMKPIDAIRRRPGMYIGDPDERGLEQLIYELVANGIDQFLAGQVTCVSIQIGDAAITVSDDGPGLPFDLPSKLIEGQSQAEEWLSYHHNSPTADGHAPHVHISRFGVGLVAIVALSESLEVISYRRERCYRQRYVRGLAEAPPHCEAAPGKGLTFRFTPDPTIFHDHRVRLPVLRRRLFDTVHLIPGLAIELNDERFHAPGGLSDYARFLTAEPEHYYHSTPPFLHARAKLEEATIEVALCGETKGATTYRSWCNGSHTCLHGSHVDGLRDALRNFQWKPITALVHVLMKTPRFAGPTRDQLESDAARAWVRNAVRAELRAQGFQQAKKKASK